MLLIDGEDSIPGLPEARSLSAEHFCFAAGIT